MSCRAVTGEVDSFILATRLHFDAVILNFLPSFHFKLLLQFLMIGP